MRVLASTINIDDIHVAEGTFYGGILIGVRPAPNHPVTPASDLAGIVVGVGQAFAQSGSAKPSLGYKRPSGPGGPGRKVCAIDERCLTLKPEKLSFGTAAACGVSGLVAFSAIRALKLRARLRIVIVGATGGIGGMAVQLAVCAGAELTGVCGSANVERANKLGCSRVLACHGASEPWAHRHSDGLAGLMCRSPSCFCPLETSRLLG